MKFGVELRHLIALSNCDFCRAVQWKPYWTSISN